MEGSQGFILPATLSIEHRETLYIKLGKGNIGVLCIFMSRTLKQTQKKENSNFVLMYQVVKLITCSISI